VLRTNFIVSARQRDVIGRIQAQVHDLDRYVLDMTAIRNGSWTGAWRWRWA